MTTAKKPLKFVAIIAGFLCVILLIAIMSIYFEYPLIVANKDSQIAAQQNQIDNISVNLTALQNQVKLLNSKVSYVQTELNGNVTALADANAQIANLTAQINFWKTFALG
jgi:peptidoglycan hydrolase CwlO-like protein